MNEKKIAIEGIIGWDFTAQDFRRETKNANGDLQIEIASAGGFVYDGIEIFNLIKSYSKEKGKVNIIINGLCASIASYIACAGDTLKAYDNAVFMIHNVYATVCGNYIELNKTAKELESLSNILAKTYANKTKIEINEIKRLMDEETFFYGNEIFENGFADGIVNSGNNETSNKDEAYTLAKNKIHACFNKMNESEKRKDDLHKAVALMTNIQVENKANENIENINQNTKNNIEKDGNIMNINEIKEKYPELYAEIQNLASVQAKEEGRKEGIEAERSRVMSHIKLAKASGLVDKALEFIESGASITSEDVLAEYHAAKLAKNTLQNRIDDNVSAQNVSSEEDIQAKADKELENRLAKDLR